MTIALRSNGQEKRRRINGNRMVVFKKKNFVLLVFVLAVVSCLEWFGAVCSFVWIKVYFFVRGCWALQCIRQSFSGCWTSFSFSFDSFDTSLACPFGF